MKTLKYICAGFCFLMLAIASGCGGMSDKSFAEDADKLLDWAKK